jgi:fumarate hydratase, class I
VATITEDDVIASVADALQYISYYHPPDFIAAMRAAYVQEKGTAARDAIAQILKNSLLCAYGHRPICQDTGVVVVFVKAGMSARWETTRSLEEIINEGVRQAYCSKENPLRASIVQDPAGKRANTRDNTPAVIHVELVSGDGIDISIAARGAGSENKAALGMLNPADSVADWVLERVAEMGAGWCPPGVLGIGIGGTADKALLLARESLAGVVDMHELKKRGANTRTDGLRIEIYERINALGIGAQGLGGLTTVLDVKVREYPTHAASLPVAVIPTCAATRHIRFRLDGTGAARFDPPDLKAWPKLILRADESAQRVVIDRLTRAEVASWRVGERLLLSGRILTARDAAHKRVCGLLKAGKPLPAGLSFNDRIVYYVGPVGPVGNEVVGPAGPTTASRMDRFTETMLTEAGVLAMIGKAERSVETVELIRRQRCVYLVAVGGAAYLVSQAIRASRVVAFGELGMEAVHEFEVTDMPVTVAVDSTGVSIHEVGPREWRARIAGVPVVGM